MVKLPKNKSIIVLKQNSSYFHLIFFLYVKNAKPNFYLTLKIIIDKKNAYKLQLNGGKQQTVTKIIILNNKPL
jgi:hypothetical protein